MTSSDCGRYEPSRMLLRQEALKILLNQFGGQTQENGMPKYQNYVLYECADRWVSQGNLNCDGIIKFFLSYFGD